MQLNQHARLAVAPMMDWTDPHCRYFHRQMSRWTVLYTEMVTAAALVHGDAGRLLAHHPDEAPLVLQLGGSEPELLAQAVRIAAGRGFAEINLNVGCPSDRVQSGTFGAVLMKDPARVAACVQAMQDAADVPVTVKCRIGVDAQEPAEILPHFLETIARAGVRSVTIHARKAWLDGLSPKENREVPPLDYPLVLAMKRRFPELHITINGGVASLDVARALLDQGLDGVMIGRAAYHDPGAILMQADPLIFERPAPLENRAAAVHAMLPYAEAHLRAGGRLNQITRHMLGLFAGLPGARRWRRMLSEQAHLPGADPGLLLRALAEVSCAE